MNNWKRPRHSVMRFCSLLVPGLSTMESEDPAVLKSSMNFHLPNSNLAQFVAILVNITSVVDHVGTIVHETANDTARLLGETLAISASE